MNDKRNIFDISSYILISILAIVLFYALVKLIYVHLNRVPPNSTNVSPITGEILSPVSSSREAVEITYFQSKDLESFSGINKANLIYEYIDPELSHIYKAVFYDTPPNNNYPVLNIEKVPLSDMPKFNFSNSLDEKIGSLKSANSVYLKVNGLIPSSFIFKNGEYIYFKDKIAERDLDNGKYVTASNIIVQIVNEEFPNKRAQGSGDGFLFMSGKVIKINWKRESGPIRFYDENGNEISLATGKTWIAIGNKETSVVYD